jgi:hypothetical protein
VWPSAQSARPFGTINPISRIFRATHRGISEARDHIDDHTWPRDYFVVKINDKDLQEPDQSLGKSIKRTIRRPRRGAPSPEALRGWAKSAVRNRSKS